MKLPGFVGGAYESASLIQAAQTCVNVFPEVSEGKGRNAGALYPRPGLSAHITLPDAPVRGVWAGEDRLFAAAGTHVYEVGSDGSLINTFTGTINDDAAHSPVQIYSNGDQLYIVSAGYAYCINDGETLVQQYWGNGEGVVDTAGTTVTWVSGTEFDESMEGNLIGIAGVDFTVLSVESPTSLTLTGSAGTQDDVAYAAVMPVRARTGTFLDTYFFAVDGDTNDVYMSESSNGMSWLAEEKFSKEGYPDEIATILADHEELWLFGSHHSTEVWRNEGDENLPGGFRRDPGAFIHMGCVAPWSVASVDQGVAWLAGDTRGKPFAAKTDGFTPSRISTHALETIWETYTNVADCYAYAVAYKGHSFYVMNFQTDNATWVYDVTTREWHRWSTNGLTHKFRGRNHCFVFGKHFVGDHTTGVIYEMSDEFADDNGTAISWERACPHTADELKRIFYSEVELDAEVASDGTTPSVTLDWSDDGGHNFGTAKTITPSLGNRKGRLRWRRVGSARNRVLRFAGTGRRKLIDVYIDAGSGAH